MAKNLVYIGDYGLLGTNFYWFNYESKGLTKEDILSAGLTNGKVQVHKTLIPALLSINRHLNALGFRLFIKEGYRSKSLYEIVYKKRVIKFGKEDTDRQLNMHDMPHASGKSIDAALWGLKEDKEIYMRNGADGTDALFYDFYKSKLDFVSQNYQRLQDLLVDAMLSNGFKHGTKNEYFHFDFTV